MTERIRWEPGERVTISAVVESAGHDDQHVIVRVGGVPVQVPVSSLGAVFPEEEYEFEEFDEARFRAQYAPGRRVRFTHPDNGYEGDQRMAAAHLTPGEVYTIAWSSIGQSSTLLGLAEVETHGQGFNSVLFEPADDEEAAVTAAGEE